MNQKEEIETESENQDWPNLNRYKKENYDLNLDLNEGNRVIFMGDSITEGWSALYPDFFKKRNYVNRGISGQTTPQMLIRFRSDVIDLLPKTVVILAGTNDIAENTGPSNVKMITDNIFSMAELGNAHSIKIVLCSVLPVFKYSWKNIIDPPSYIYEVNSMIEEYCLKNNYKYLDYYSSMVDGQKGLMESLTEDGVHPNEKGYEVMSQLFQERM
ncbi:SGNH/GDSL hydrolase family protein [Candidatus Marinimicrobia bacterium]|nr:SGNH/GDSL hydrolase family protein [Candidatus Neomarinimicrobiota bacterium]